MKAIAHGFVNQIINISSKVAAESTYISTHSFIPAPWDPKWTNPALPLSWHKGRLRKAQICDIITGGGSNYGITRCKVRGTRKGDASGPPVPVGPGGCARFNPHCRRCDGTSCVSTDWMGARWRGLREKRAVDGPKSWVV